MGLPLHRQRQLLRRNGGKMHGMGQRGGRGHTARGRYLLFHRHAVLVHGVHMYLFPVIQKHDIRPVARRNGPHALQAIHPRGIIACHANGVHHRHAKLHGLVHVPADMPLAGNVVQVLVIGAEQKTIRGQALFQQALHNGREVFGGAALAHQNGQPCGQLFLCLGKAGALVLCLNAGGRIGCQSLAGKPRRVPVDMLVGKQGQLAVNFACAGHHIRITHHFPQPRHTGGHHPVNIHRQGLAGLQQPFHRRGAAHIYNFVRVCHHGGGARHRHRARKFIRHRHGRFHMNVRIYKAGAQIQARAVHLFFPAVLPHARNHAGLYGHVCLFHLLCEHVHHLRIFEHKLCLFAPGRRFNHTPLHGAPAFLCPIFRLHALPTAGHAWRRFLRAALILQPV